MRPLVISGGPAAGKSTCGRLIAANCDRGAFIDVDDIRQIVVSGAATLWSGQDGERQLLLAARNTAALGRNFLADGFDVVAADFVTQDSLVVYKAELTDCFVVHLEISLDGALQRAATRNVYLTDAEFELLHRMIETPPQADAILNVEGLTTDQQTQAIAELWVEASGSRRRPIFVR